MPDPRSVKFITSYAIGYSDSSLEVFDSYGRRPWQPEFQDNDVDKNEWKTFHAFQKEYEKLFGAKRRGVTYD